jgi:hypothetical protein
MKNLSFIIPDQELNTKLTRLLFIFRELSLNKLQNPVLNIEKLAAFDFLLQHVYILHAVLRRNNKRLLFSLTNEEANSINREYPNTSELYDHKELKVTLQILLVYRLITVKLSTDNDALYTISQHGMVFLDDFSSEYGERLQEITKAIVPLQGESFRNLITMIKPYING